jgi:hypothetical protein
MNHNTVTKDRKPAEVSESKLNDLLSELCTWTQDESKVFWDSGCGEPFKFSMRTGPFDNKYIFCPFCGRKIQVG